MRRAPFDEQVPLQGVSVSCRRALAEVMVSTTSWGRSPVSVREGSLGEMHICEGPAASCVPVCPCRVFLRSGSRTTGNATSLGTRTGLPVRVQNVANQLDRLGMESPFSGERSSSAVRLSKPGI